MTIRRPYTRFLLLALLAAAMPHTLQAQEGKPRQTGQRTSPAQRPSLQPVDSRRGYVAKIPAEAVLDSSRSGWSPKGLYELRTYLIQDAAMIRFIATVRSADPPADAINTGTYIYTQSDSATPKGTAKIRTYYLPTRNVRIEIIPFSLKGHQYVEPEASEKIFGSLRWKPGATTDKQEVE